MARHCAWAVRKGWLTAACCAWLLAGGLAAPLHALEAEEPQVEIEQYSGNRKLGQEPVVPAATAPTQPTTPAAQPTFQLPASEPAQQPAAPNQSQLLGEVSEQLLRSTSKLAQECGTAVQSCAGTVSQSSSRLVETLGGKSRPDANVRVEVALQPASHTETPGEMAPVVADAAQPLEVGMPWYKVVWLQIAVGSGAMVAGPLLVALMLGIMLRRSGWQLRVEVTNPGMLRAEPETPHTLPTGLPTEPVEDVFTGEAFDLGPTYEEERLAKENALRQAEMAVMQEIFEQNVRLQDELRGVNSPTITTDQPADEQPAAETTVTAPDPLSAVLEQYATMWPNESLDK